MIRSSIKKYITIISIVAISNLACIESKVRLAQPSEKQNDVVTITPEQRSKIKKITKDYVKKLQELLEESLQDEKEFVNKAQEKLDKKISHCYGSKKIQKYKDPAKNFYIQVNILHQAPQIAETTKDKTATIQSLEALQKPENFIKKMLQKSHPKQFSHDLPMPPHIPEQQQDTKLPNGEPNNPDKEETKAALYEAIEPKTANPVHNVPHKPQRTDEPSIEITIPQKKNQEEPSPQNNEETVAHYMKYLQQLR